jgi:hypothetical protein
MYNNKNELSMLIINSYIYDIMNYKYESLIFIIKIPIIEI